MPQAIMRVAARRGGKRVFPQHVGIPALTARGELRTHCESYSTPANSTSMHAVIPTSTLPPLDGIRYPSARSSCATVFVQVFKARRLADGKMVALKCIKQEDDGKGFPVTAIREMRILRRLHHKVQSKRRKSQGVSF